MELEKSGRVEVGRALKTALVSQYGVFWFGSDASPAERPEGFKASGPTTRIETAVSPSGLRRVAGLFDESLRAG